MKYEWWLPLILTIMVLPVAVWALLSENRQPIKTDQAGLILYYGDTCPHCAIVDEYLRSSGAAEKIPFAHKEVYRNSGNASELSAKAAACGLDRQRIGVPFLWADGQCLVGDQPIIEYFKKKMEYAQ